MASLVEFPKAPLSPIMVSFMRCRESRAFLGSYEARPKAGDVIAFIPYLDLPHYALDEERAIAFIDADGFRGWIAKDDVSTHFDIMTPGHEKCQPYFELFERQGWEATPIMWSAIDWKTHFRLRTDDESYDMTPSAFFAECDLTTPCEWCGHPNLTIDYKRDKGKTGWKACEACQWSKDDEIQDVKNREIAIEIDFEETTGFLGLSEDWA